MKYIFILIPLLLCSCLSYSVVPVTVTVTKSGEVDLQQYKTALIIAVTPEAEVTAQKLKEQFSLSHINIVEEKSDLRIEITTQQSFDASQVEEKGAVTTIEKKTDTPNSSEKPEYESTRKTEFTRYHKFSMDVNFNIIRTVDDKAIYSKRYQPTTTIERKKTGESPPVMDSTPEFAKTNDFIVSSFLQTITPTKISEIILIEKVSHTLFDKSVSLAKIGQWQKVREIFEQIQKEMNDEDNVVKAKNYYNYALAIQYNSYQENNQPEELRKAINIFEKAYSLFPEQLYKNQQEKCMEELEYLEKLVVH